VDVGTFERLLDDGRPEALEQAVALYRGDLLDGFGLRDAAFEDWLLVERQRLPPRAEAGLAGLLSQSRSVCAGARAAVAARRVVTLEPVREAACRALMQVDAVSEEAAQSLKVYETLRDRLHRELGVKPEVETTKLYDSIRQRRTDPVPPSSVSPPIVRTDDGSRPSAPELPIPSKPSIAVLPFRNLSGDPEQEDFADGIVEDITSGLARMHWLFVIARNSSFTYKGRAVDMKQIGRELGVRYLLEGSVRKAGERIRITSQLVDAASGAHIWSDRFD